ncbi:MAG: cupin domain-containing protein [Candidatus Rokubacteria bacterium]|nr:cupin domain-containing protein [Candidatus Rokubacteria bacterium]
MSNEGQESSATGKGVEDVEGRKAPGAGRLPDPGGATAVLAKFAAKLQELRAARGFSLEGLAEKASLSAGLLSQLERGVGNPSFLTIAKIAYALDVPIGTFFEGPRTEGVVVRRHERKRLIPRDAAAVEGPIYELLTPDVYRKLEVVYVELPPHMSSNKEQPFSHEGEECGVLLSGRLEVHLGDETYVLETGDSISYQSVIPHWYNNPGDEPATSIWVITPPSF